MQRVGEAALFINQDELTLWIHRDNHECFQQILSRHVQLVKKIVDKYPTRLQEDLFQEGCIGLNRAVQKFDVTRNIHFSTYAYAWIRKYILEHLRRDDQRGLIPIEVLQAWKESEGEYEDGSQSGKQVAFVDPDDLEIKSEQSLIIQEIRSLHPSLKRANLFRMARLSYKRCNHKRIKMIRELYAKRRA